MKWVTKDLNNSESDIKNRKRRRKAEAG